MIQFIGIFFLFLSTSLIAGLGKARFPSADLGTINSIKNGFGTTNECREVSKVQCEVESIAQDSLKGILDFATTNQCLSSTSDFQSMGIDIPKCPTGDEQVKILPNTYPSNGIFALYRGNNSGFIIDMVTKYLEANSVGKFNIIVPLEYVNDLAENKKLSSVLNNERVNLITLPTMPKTDFWMQDSFQFTSVEGEPAIVQLDQRYEKELPIEKRLACQLAAICNIPYYLPPDMVKVDQEIGATADLDAGGNLEALPDGTVIMGTIQTKGYNHKLSAQRARPFKTKRQKELTRNFIESGQKVLDLDVSFLSIAHVDEIVNVVKTNRPAPCDFAIMIASPKKAFEIMDKTNLSKEKSLDADVICREESGYQSLKNYGSKDVIDKAKEAKIKDNLCINGKSINAFKKSPAYRVAKKENFEDIPRTSYSTILEKNKNLLKDHFINNTECKEPEFIDIPVLFRDGDSYTPNMVNGVVNTEGNNPSHVILPKSYFAPFDEYVESELQKYGITTTLAHDMIYHLAMGEVHCATNDSRICRP